MSAGLVSPSSDAFRDVLARLAGGVAVMATCTGSDAPIGVTVSALCSVSLEPPLVLTCLAHTASVYPAFVACDSWGISLLSAEQSALSDRFAQRGGQDWDGVALHPSVTGVPLLAGALGWIECRRHARHEAGDHDIFVGHVQALALGTDAPALIWYQRGYSRAVSLSSSKTR